MRESFVQFLSVGIIESYLVQCIILGLDPDICNCPNLGELEASFKLSIRFDDILEGYVLRNTVWPINLDILDVSSKIFKLRGGSVPTVAYTHVYFLFYLLVLY